jgi:GNAT superfamily N-acetyltransferase
MNIIIRAATEADVPALLAFIKELAQYEKLAHEVSASEEQLRVTLFGPRPFAEALLGCVDDVPVGFALFFHNYSTFLGRPGLYLEDLFVRPMYRGRGIGRMLLASVARLAVERGCGRYEWAVLEWNEPSIHFYQKLGADIKGDWRIMRVTGPALEKMAELAPMCAQ